MKRDCRHRNHPLVGRSGVKSGFLPNHERVDMMKEESILSVWQAFGDLRDPRSSTPAHGLTDMLVVALCAVLSGADSWLGI